MRPQTGRLFSLIIFGFFIMLGLSAPVRSDASTAITIGTGTAGGTYFPVGGAMARIWNRNMSSVRALALSTGGTVQNIQLLRRRDIDIAFSDGLSYHAYMGDGVFEGQPTKELRVLSPLYSESMHFVVRKGSNIKTFADLKGKRVSVGARGSGIEAIVRVLLECAGLDVRSDIIAHSFGLAETAAAIKNKRIDAALLIGYVGVPSIVDICNSVNVEFINIPHDSVKKISDEMPFMKPFIIPANSYAGQRRDVSTFGSWNFLLATDRLPDNVAYEMVKALYANKRELVRAAKAMADMSPENIRFVDIPLHPGAERFYRDLRPSHEGVQGSDSAGR